MRTRTLYKVRVSYVRTFQKIKFAHHTRIFMEYGNMRCCDATAKLTYLLAHVNKVTSPAYLRYH